MASPIFISNPSESFSISIVLRGIQLGYLSTYRCLQNPRILYHSNFWPSLITIVKLSLLLYILLNGPLFITKIFFICINSLKISSINSKHILDLADYVLENIFNINIFLISLYGSYLDTTADELFMASLNFSDSVLSSRYYANLSRFQNDTVRINSQQSAGDTTWQRVRFLFKRSSHFKNFLNRYFQYYLFNFGIFLLICYPGKMSTVVLGLISFQVLSDKLGAVPSILLITLLNMLPCHYTAQVLITFYGSSNLSYDLLAPYFQRLNMTKYEKKQWINSRNGVLFGFGLVNYLMINTFPQFAIVLYALAQLNMAYLVTKITDVPPDQANKLISWTSSQLLWSDQYKLVSGKFIDDPFVPIPGSFIFS
ncbi:hypothetical protein G9P44_000401 [Scheffersomyces stipitis]|nr:hypothetical protein G9P44_000401 [Scheffersomyces stipitis]